MQSIAMENNLSETAFLIKNASDYHIRCFSPLKEVDFCGHATLAASAVLFEKEPSEIKVKIFAEAVGYFTVVKKDDGSIQMDFPIRTPEPVIDIPAPLLEGLSAAPVKVLRNNQAYFAIFNEASTVISLETNSELLKQLAPYDVVVSAPVDNGEYDFISRYFWPANGGDEDPVTGSIHTELAPYWAKLLGKNTLVAYQASQRGGVLLCEVAGDRVRISGNTIHNLHGTIAV